MGWFGKLLGTDKAMDTVKESAKSTFSIIDEAFYTDQEKADTRAKAAAIWLSAQKVVATQSAPTAISRRIIAWSIIGIVCFMVLQGCIYVAFDDAGRIEKLIELAKSFWIGEAFTSVMVFYFGAHLLGSKK